MRKRRLVGLAVGIGLAALALGLLGRRARSRDAEAAGEGGGASATLAIDPAPLVVVNGAFDDVTISPGSGPSVSVVAFGVRDASEAVRCERDDQRGRVVLSVRPGRRLDVFVPPGVAVRLCVAKSRSAVYGVDDVDVRCAKSAIHLHDVAGTVRLRCAKTRADVVLARDRATRSVDAEVAKGRVAIAVPSTPGGVYDVRSAKGHVDVPGSVEGGIPVKIRAAKASVAVRAA
ncbi:MAG TPA: hypothetical protein VFB22_12345 [Candidatus Baltobacteraceae bacterium]|nr:hypothetical protein [Candidatus Baltobacteraceae bacterium]